MSAIQHLCKQYKKDPLKSGKCDLSKNDKVVRTTVGNLDLKNVKPKRAGIVLYYIQPNKEILFGFGIDARFGEITDFAGGIKKKDGNAICGALREFHEETLFIFNDIPVENINECPVFYDESNLIIFMLIDINPVIVTNSFNTRYAEIVMKNVLKRNDHKHLKPIIEPEISQIVWMNVKDFYMTLYNSNNFYHVVRNFLISIGDVAAMI